MLRVRLPAPLRNMRFVMHVGLTGMLIWWTFILAIPVSTFPTSQSYVEFARICPNELYWASGFGFSGLIGCAGCWAAWPARYATFNVNVTRVASAIALGINHGVIATLTLRSNPSGTGSGIYFIVMIMAYLLAASEIDRAE